MNSHMRTILAATFCMIICAAGGVWAELSEPDHIIYGNASWYGTQLAAGAQVTLTLEGQQDVISRYTIGADATLGSMFALRVPLDAVGERLPRTARPGDRATIFIDGTLAGRTEIGERGSVQQLTVDPEIPEALPGVSVSDVAVVEPDAGTTPAVFSISVNSTSEDTITVQWITAAGTATGGASCGSGVDFLADNGMATINPGDTSVEISVMVCGETVQEGDEEFFIDLSNPTNASLLDPQGKGTIVDDDTPPRVSINNITVREPSTGPIQASFRVSLSKVWEYDVRVDFATANGTAEAGLDYLATSGSGASAVVIPVGSLESTISVDILDDTVNEDDETFFVNLSNPVNATILDGQGQAIIVDAAQFLQWIETEIDGISGDGLAGTYAVAVSPDGNNVYAAGRSDDAVVVFDRDPATGELSYLSAYTPDEFSNRAVAAFIGLGGVEDLVVSADGLNLYVAAFDDDAVTVFARDPADGSLTLVEVERDGVNDLSDPGGTVDGLNGATALALSPSSVDGTTLYVVGSNDNAVAVFSVSETDGRLTFREMERDGVDDIGDPGGIVNGLNQASDVVVSPDGAHVYVTGTGDHAVATFTRETDPGSGQYGWLSYLEVDVDGSGGADGLAGATAIAVSPDGGSVYVAGQSDDAVASFVRDNDVGSGGFGSLTFQTKVENGSGGVSGLLGASAVAVSQDGSYVYAAGYLSNALVVFERDTSPAKALGELSFIEVKTDGVGGVDGLFGAADVAVTADDASVYTAGRLDNAVAAFSRDLTPPDNPMLSSPSHQIAPAWSNNPVITLAWSGAADNSGGTGVAGYSVAFTTDPGGPLDEIVDVTHTGDVSYSLDSPVLPAGTSHYAHLLTCDHSDNCSAAESLGPFQIDTSAPSTPVIASSSHLVGVPSEDPTIQVWWNAATDPGPVASGVAGYSYNFNLDAVGQCNMEIDVPAGGSSATSVDLKVGLYYFHMCAADMAGNWSGVATSGPYEIINDNIPPKVIKIASVSGPGSVDTSLGTTVNHGVTQILLSYSKSMHDPVGDSDPADVSNPANYMLVGAGPDSLFETVGCGAVGGDDVSVPLSAVVYDSASKVAAIDVAGDLALPMGQYRFAACAASALQDINGNPLDGDADGIGEDDYQYAFLVTRTNLLVNPNLDNASLQPDWGWSAADRVAHSADDADGAATSGSIWFERLAGDDLVISVQQLVDLPVWDGSPMYLYGRVRVNEALGGDPGQSGASANVEFFDGPDGTGSQVGSAQTNLVIDDTLGAWLVVSTEIALPPPTAISALVSYEVQLPTGEDYELDAWFDSLRFQQADGVPPVAPTLVSTSHTSGVWSNDPAVDMQWSGASDTGVGISGYSYLFDSAAGTVPDLIEDMAHHGQTHTTSSGTLADGSYYFHLASCDFVDNCVVQHRGPYLVDTVVPTLPANLTSPSHSPGVPSDDSVLVLTWSPSVDPPPVPSGLVGYDAALTTNSAEPCDGGVDLAPDTVSFTTNPLSNGTYYFRMCAVDAAGNRTDRVLSGPYIIADATAPQVLGVGTVSATEGGTLTAGGTTSASITQLVVGFSEPVFDPAGDSSSDDVTNPANYLLLTAGGDGFFETTSCTAVIGDDQQLGVSLVSYDLASRQAAVRVAGVMALPADSYRFLVCGSTSIRDYNDNILDGNGDGSGGDDLLLPFVVSSDNLLTNPNLDDDLTGWSKAVTPPTDFVHSATDGDGAPTSGSAFLSNASGSDVSFGLSQCVELSELDITYELRGLAWIDQIGVASPGAYLVVDFMSGAGCTGSILDTMMTNQLSGDTGGMWQSMSNDNVPIPVGSVSAMVGVVVGVGSGSPAEFDAGFDNLYFGAAPHIFADGFESGTLGAWSTSAP